MSRNNRKSGSATRASALVGKRISDWQAGWLLGGLVLLSVIGFVANQSYWRFMANRDYLRARELFPDQPAQVEKLTEQAVMNSGGHYPEAQLLQCRAFAATGQWDAALGGFSLIKDFSKCDAADLVSFAEASLQASEWKLAEKALEVAAEKSGLSACRAKELLTAMDIRFLRADEAMARCLAWQRKFPDDATAWALAADIQRSRLRLAEAIEGYQQALKRSAPAEFELRVRSSLFPLLVHTGDTAGADEVLKTLLDSGPLTPAVRLSYAQLLRLQGQAGKSLAEVDELIAAAGPTAESLKLRGILRLDEGNTSEAIEDLKESVRLNSYDIGAQHMLGQAYLQAKNPEAAQPHLDRSQELTRANTRISELEEQLHSDPGNADLTRELKTLKAVVGR